MAVDRCDECLRHFCADCFACEAEPLFCQDCMAAAPLRQAKAARARRWGLRLRRAVSERLGGFAAAGVILGVLTAAARLALFAGGSLDGGISQALGDEPSVPATVLSHGATPLWCLRLSLG